MEELLQELLGCRSAHINEILTIRNFMRRNNIPIPTIDEVEETFGGISYDFLMYEYLQTILKQVKEDIDDFFVIEKGYINGVQWSTGIEALDRAIKEGWDLEKTRKEVMKELEEKKDK